MKYCCEKFQDKINYVGKKGICIIPEDYEESHFYYFSLQYRNYDIGYEQEVKTLSIGCSAIQFCPYCGKKLSELIKEDLEGFKKILKENRRYLSM